MDRHQSRNIQSTLFNILGTTKFVCTHDIPTNLEAASTSLAICLNAARLVLSLEALGCYGVDLLFKLTQKDFVEVLKALNFGSEV